MAVIEGWRKVETARQIAERDSLEVRFENKTGETRH